MPINLDLFESRIVHEYTYPHSREHVWQALTDSELLSAWLMDNTLKEVEVGQIFQFHGDPVPVFWDGIVRCEIIEVEYAKRLRISWWGGGGNPQTEVTWRLTDVEEGTNLTVTHTGFDGLRGFIMKMGMRGGWETMYDHRLPKVLGIIDEGETSSFLDNPACESH